MKLGSRAISLLLACSVSLITTAFLSLMPAVDFWALLVTFLLSFSSGYILSEVVLNFLFFKEINTLYDMLKDVRNDNDFSKYEVIDVGKPSINPLKQVNQEIYTFVQDKRKEIDDLKRMEIFRREFIADVSHELKTPIFAAQGFVHTLLDGAVEDKKVRMKFLKKAAKSLDGLDILVQDLLTISQMETGEIKMHFEVFDIKKVARDVLEQLEDKSNKKKVSLGVRCEEEGPVMVYADKRRIGQVLSNLMLNAIKYNKQGGEVELGLVPKKNQVNIYIKDTGVGIPAEDLGRIFERFYRVEKSRSKDKGGTGLGLAIVKHIIEAHQSNVRVSSTAGKGSVFSFELARKKQNLPDTHVLVESEV